MLLSHLVVVHIRRKQEQPSCVRRRYLAPDLLNDHLRSWLKVKNVTITIIL